MRERRAESKEGSCSSVSVRRKDAAHRAATTYGNVNSCNRMVGFAVQGREEMKECDMKKILLAAVVMMVAVYVQAAGIPDSIKAAVAENVGSYEYTKPREPLIAIEEFAAHTSADAEQRAELAALFGKILADPSTTEAGRMFICQQLAVIGTDGEIPVLAELLKKEDAVEAARLALQGMESSAADAALREGLSIHKGKALAGIVLSLGARRDEASVREIIKLLKNKDDVVAGSAATALGMIGSKEAAKALMKTDDLDAKLRCSEHLIRDGDDKTARKMADSLCDRKQSLNNRTAGLALLAKLAADEAAPGLLEAATDEDETVSLTAMRLAGGLKDEKVTSGLVKILQDIDTERQVQLLGILAERGDAAASAGVTELMKRSENPGVGAAAARALGGLGDADTVCMLAEFAAGKDKNISQAAEDAIARLSGPGVDANIIGGIVSGLVPTRVILINAAGQRSMESASEVLLAAAADSDESVRIAALKALAKAGTEKHYSRILDIVVKAGDSGTRSAAEAALLAVGKKVSDAKTGTEPLIEVLDKKDVPVDTVVSIVKVLSGLGGPEAVTAVKARATSTDQAVCDAAVRALSGWADEGAVDALICIAGNTDNGVHRTLSMRGLFRLAEKSNNIMGMVRKIRPLVKGKDDRIQMLGILSRQKTSDALDMAAGLLGEKDTAVETAAAVLTVAENIVQTDTESVEEAVKKVTDSVPDVAVQERVKKLLAQVSVIQAARQENSMARIKALAKDLPAGCSIPAYIDCGPEAGGGLPDGARLRIIKGGLYDWAAGASSVADKFAATIAYSDEVIIEALGLKQDCEYQLVLRWWDYDNNNRKQSVWVGDKRILEPTQLPAWKDKSQAPATVVIPLSSDLIRDGKIQFKLHRDGGSNVVVSEAWLIEGRGSSQPAVKPVAQSGDNASTKVLIATGWEYHNWKETAPILKKAIGEDPRMEVTVSEDINILGSEELKKYDVIVLHYMNNKIPGPGPEVLENFRKAIEGGTGLVMVHFACGAFQGWPEFVKIAGRVWDPKLRGHDPRGKFNVNILDPGHPVMKGVEPFETLDELYTCLTGDTPIKVIANAKSKVDSKDYPMAFVLEYGKGRVMHCVLGHDGQAFCEQVCRIYRNGCAWTAGLE